MFTALIALLTAACCLEEQKEPIVNEQEDLYYNYDARRNKKSK